MNNQEIKEFFKSIENLMLNKQQKKRMLRLIQVRGLNSKNKVMTLKDFVNYINCNNGKITNLVMGPKWNRLVFVDIDIEV